jgi:predicted nucleic acid-binding protein
MTAMITDSFFVDSNVLLYWALLDERKSAAASKLLAQGPCISAQVLNEMTSVMRRKYKMEWREISDILEATKEACRCFPVTLDTHERGFDIAAESGLRIYDACIVAAAELAGCNILYTEDMNSGQRIGGVTLRDPFEET